jgi:hypothetical protein
MPATFGVLQSRSSRGDEALILLSEHVFQSLVTSAATGKTRTSTSAGILIAHASLEAAVGHGDVRRNVLKVGALDTSQ